MNTSQKLCGLLFIVLLSAPAQLWASDVGKPCNGKTCPEENIECPSSGGPKCTVTRPYCICKCVWRKGPHGTHFVHAKSNCSPIKPKSTSDKASTQDLSLSDDAFEDLLFLFELEDLTNGVGSIQ